MRIPTAIWIGEPSSAALRGASWSRRSLFFDARREQFVALAARSAVPAIYEVRDYVLAGG